MTEPKAAFHRTLNGAAELGEIRRKANTRALARFLVNTMQGLVVLSKGKIGKKTCHDVISVGMVALAA